MTPDEVFRIVANHGNTQRYGNRITVQYMRQRDSRTYEVRLRLHPMFGSSTPHTSYYGCMWVDLGPYCPAIAQQVNEMVRYLVDSWDRYCNSLLETERGAVSDSPPFNPMANP